jgi:inner membrane protein
MDSITHVAIGAILGEAFAGKTVGKKAMLWGILAQSIPDIDFIVMPFLGTTEGLLAHRGFSHSIIFMLMVAPMMALLAERIHRPHDISLTRWMLFFASAISIHLFVDGFNNYGVGWLEPFFHNRFSFNTIYVVDPVFSIGPGIAFFMLLIMKRKNPKRKWWWRFGMLSMFIYLGYSLINKSIINEEVTKSFRAQQISHEKYLSTPAPFQNLLWFVAAGNDSGFHVGYRSVFDKGPMQMNFFPRNEHLLAPYRGSDDLYRLKQFSQGFYTASVRNDTLMFNDLRFGQVIGWVDPSERFAFHYYLQYPDANGLVVQRGRFEKLHCVKVSDYWARMLGIRE